MPRQRAELGSGDAGEPRPEAPSKGVDVVDVDVSRQAGVDDLLKRSDEIGLDHDVAGRHHTGRVGLAVGDVRGLPGRVDDDGVACGDVIGELAKLLLGLGQADRGVGVERIP